MKKSAKRVIILTEVLALAGLAALIPFVGINDWVSLETAQLQSRERSDEVEAPTQVIAFEDASGRAQEAGDPVNVVEEVLQTGTPYDCGPPVGWVIYQVQDVDSLEFLLASTGITLEGFQQCNCLGDSVLVLPGMNVFLPVIPERPTSTPVPTNPPAPTSVPEEDETPLKTPTVTEPDPVPTAAPPEGRSINDWVNISVGRINGYVERPGTGWQYYWSSPRENTIPQTVAYGERDQMSWKILNPAENVYNWDPIDDQMAVAVSRGEQFSFRVYTVSGSLQVPQWALNADVEVYSNGEIDYANCVYQEKWGEFVNALVARYDGNPDIALIDISGYSDYNEWAWENQTEWDYLWETRYKAGTASASTMSTLDSYARRRLADIFIGGSFNGHECKLANGSTTTVNYSYNGFQQTQLILPYGGIRQTTQYVFLRRPDVGMRNDGWGSDSSNGIYDGLWKELNTIWKNAPIVLETTSASQFNYANAEAQVIQLHGSLIHHIKNSFTDAEITELVGYAGYRFALLGAGYDSVVSPGENLQVSLAWRNIGSTRPFQKMGQTFSVYVYLTDMDDAVVQEYHVPGDPSNWVPSHGSKDIARGTETSGVILVPALSPDTYKLKVAIIHDWDGEPIGLDADLNVVDGLYQLGLITVTEP